MVWLPGLLRPQGEPVAVEVTEVLPLQIRVPEQLYLARSRGIEGGSSSEPGAAGQAGAPGSTASAVTEPTDPGSGSPQPRRGGGSPPVPQPFQLPDIPRTPDTVQTVLQPASPPDLAPPEDMQWANLLLWAAAPMLAPPERERFVPPTPGSRTPPTTPLISDAPPVLEMPNRELDAGELRMASSPMLEPPELPVRPASVTPLRTFVPPEIERPEPSAILDLIEGVPTNLLAVSPDPAPMPEFLEVYAGNVLSDVVPPAAMEQPGTEFSTTPGQPGSGGGEGDEPGQPDGNPEGLVAGVRTDASGVGGGGAGGAGGNTGAGFGDSEATGSGRGSGGGTGVGIGTGSGAGGTGTGQGGGGVVISGGGLGPGYGRGRGSGTGAGAGSGLGGGGGTGVVSLGGPGPGPGRGSGAPIRMEHPTDLSFDVVVVGSSAADGIPGSAGVLSGKPVYSVYLRVGGPREWMLQYCIPNQGGEADVLDGNAITITNPTPVQAPHPRLTVVPPPSLLPPGRRVMVHGYLAKSGSFRDLRVLGDESGEIGSLLIPLLEEWTLVPASRDGVPVEVELLLVIPPYLA